MPAASWLPERDWSPHTDGPLFAAGWPQLRVAPSKRRHWMGIKINNNIRPSARRLGGGAEHEIQISAPPRLSPGRPMVPARANCPPGHALKGLAILRACERTSRRASSGLDPLVSRA